MRLDSPVSYKWAALAQNRQQEFNPNQPAGFDLDFSQL
jgi:hypothetical protein